MQWYARAKGTRYRGSAAQGGAYSPPIQLDSSWGPFIMLRAFRKLSIQLCCCSFIRDMVTSIYARFKASFRLQVCTCWNVLPLSGGQLPLSGGPDALEWWTIGLERRTDALLVLVQRIGCRGCADKIQQEWTLGMYASTLLCLLGISWALQNRDARPCCLREKVLSLVH
jgi:hypothetical protein